MKKLAQLCNWILIALIKGYQNIISPMLGTKCRYTPSCSQYAIEAIKKYGPFMGSWYGLKRVGSCHPWGGQGYDPIP